MNILIRNLRTLWMVLLLPVLLATCRNPESKATWLVQPLTIDGDDDDWGKIPAVQFESFPASLKLANDGRFFYLALILNDPALAGRIDTRGIELGFTVPHEQQAGLRFRYSGADTVRPHREIPDSFWPYLTEDQKTKFRQRRESLAGMITVIQGGRRIRVPAGGEQGLAAARLFKPGHLCYEFRIPLNATETAGYALHTGTEKSIEIVIKMAEPDREDEPVMMAGPAGSGFGRRRPQRPSEQKSEVRLRVLLAEKIK